MPAGTPARRRVWCNVDHATSSSANDHTFTFWVRYSNGSATSATFTNSSSNCGNPWYNVTHTTNSWTITGSSFWDNHEEARMRQSLQGYTQAKAPPLTEEQKRQRNRRRIINEMRMLNRQHIRERAKERAEILLRSHLSEEQRESLDKNNWFMLDSKSGRRYKIERGTIANVKLVDKQGEYLAKLCVHDVGNQLPEGDVMLAQKLMLLLDEDEFIRLANAHWVNEKFKKTFYKLKAQAQKRKSKQAANRQAA